LQRNTEVKEEVNTVSSPVIALLRSKCGAFYTVPQQISSSCSSNNEETTRKITNYT